MGEGEYRNRERGVGGGGGGGGGGGVVCVFFFFNDTATTEIYTLSLHDALPICAWARESCVREARGSRRLWF